MSYEILKLSQITHYFGARPILIDAVLHLNQGERAALVGENGAGKTTLARIILGELQPDSGQITRAQNAQIGYLPQEVTSTEPITVREYIDAALGELVNLRDQLQQLESSMSEAVHDEMEKLLAHYGDLQVQFEQRGGYDLDYRIEQIFDGLNIHYIDQTRPLMSLSGGERTRVALTALLLRAPELLVLDEPTNHLDKAGIEWLEDYLMGYPNTLLLISHDRTFINAVATHIVELSLTTHDLTIYAGNYDAYLEQREAAFQREYDAFIAQAEEIKRLRSQIKQGTYNHRHTGKLPEGDKLLRNAMIATGEKTQSKAIRDAKGRLTALEADKLENPTRHWRIQFAFAPQPLTSSEPLQLVDLSKRYGDTVLFSGVNARLRKGERAVIVAPNGTGKTTLLQLILGMIQADSGAVHLRGDALPGYLDQDSLLLDSTQTVLDCYREVTSGTDQELLAELHRSGLFSDVGLGKKRVGDLSAGQRRKLALARLIASGANLLLLDEPTNHLDFPSMEALETALIHFPGAVLAVSHDRRFIDRVATHLWNLSTDGVINASLG